MHSTRGHHGLGTRRSTNPFDTDCDDDSSEYFHDAMDTFSLISSSIDNHDGKIAVALLSRTIYLNSFRIRVPMQSYCLTRRPR